MASSFKTLSLFGANQLIEPDTGFDLVDVSLNPDIVVETTGDTHRIEQAVRIVKPGGRVILVGQPWFGRDVTFRNFREFYQGKTIMDYQGGLTDPNKDIPRYLRLYQHERLDLQSMITHRFKLYDINRALGVVRAGEAGRCIVEM